MKVDLSLVLSMAAVALAIFGVLITWMSSLRLKGTIYDEGLHRVKLDDTRAAMEADLRRVYEEIYRDRDRWKEINHLLVDALDQNKPRSSSEQRSSPVDPFRFLRSFGIDPETIEVSNVVFVLTPLNKDETRSFDVVQSVCQMNGLRALRGDEHNIRGPILPVLIKEIVSARFIIANINGRNPNVFYEMGIAQALGKDVIIYGSGKELPSLPFDLAQQRIILYRDYNELHTKLIESVSQLGWGLSKQIG